ncbi:hypothetical protein [Endozoicomonas sp.]|uniref:hypothetical protein n=1 Tax=Endozoicomonas sp. TaxID=1892382 RepID=UPI0028840403|nr:hypothetical protein [Endozoicomonas sp.]
MKSFKEILKESLFFFKSNVRSICAIVLPFIIPLELFYGICDALYQDGNDSILWLASGIGLLLTPIYQGALILFLASVLTDKYLPVKTYYQRALKFWLPLMAVYILSFLATMGGFMLLIIPGLIVMGRLAFAEFYCLLHNKSGYEALWASWKSSRSEQWQLVAGLVLIPVAITIPLLLLESFLELLGLTGPVFTFVSGVISSVLFTLTTIFAFRIYTLEPDRFTGSDIPEKVEDSSES